MTNKNNEQDSELSRLAEILENDLLQLYGPLLQGESLKRAMGFRSKNALRQAISRGTVPVPIFKMKNRRGQYALTKDVAIWLAQQRFTVTNDNKGGIS